MTREIEYTYIYICPICGIEVFSTESPEEVGMRVDTCMQCNFKNRFEYIGSVWNKKKRYPIFKLKSAWWKFIKKIFRRKEILQSYRKKMEKKYPKGIGG